MKKISIYNSNNKDNQAKREVVTNKLKQNGFFPTRDGELLIVIGGDGTFLSAVHKRMEQNPIFVGFNAGNLGFLSEFTINQFDEFMKILKKEEFWIEEIPVYEVHYKEKSEAKVDYFINDFVIERRDPAALHMGVQVDAISIGTFSADNVIVSTNLGSSGYNLSAGGAVNLNANPFLQVKATASIFSPAYPTFSSGLLFSDESEITIFPNAKKQRPFRLVCDGKEVRTKNVRYVEIKKSKKTIRVLRSKNYNRIQHFKNKMLTFE